MKKDWMIKESELDENQRSVLNAVVDKSCIVSGCAGSGKSILALVKAQRIQKERGNDYQIVVFTKALCRYMNSGRKQLGLNKTFTYHWDWKNRLHCPKSDYIIVDEIQDFTTDEIREFIQATRKQFFFYGDTAQSIYEGLKDTIGVDDIRFSINEARNAKYWELYNNYRLPVPVARLSQYIGVDLPPFVASTYKSPEKEVPHIIEYDSYTEQLEAIHRIIEDQNLTDVAILLPHNNNVLFAYNHLRNMGGNYELRYKDNEDYKQSQDTLNFDSSNPKIMTYHSAKGLQFETVFLPFLEDYEEEQRKALYVAVTRTYKNLYLMWSDYEPDFLSDIPNDLYITEETTTIDDI